MLVKLYCSTCERHTPHSQIVAMDATQCSVCHTITNQLMRLQAESHTFKAPDGNQAVVVENNPSKTVFYVSDGQHKGYYHHDKRTGKNNISSV